MSILDIVNSFRLDNVEDSNKLGARRYELGERAQYLRDAYGVNVPSLYAYSKMNPTEVKPNGIGIFSGLSLGVAALCAVGMVIGLATGNFPAAGAFFKIGAAFTALGLSAAFLNDPKVDAELETSEKYEGFLDEIEGRLELASGKGLHSTQAIPDYTQGWHPAREGQRTENHFQDIVDESRAMHVVGRQ
ncbi:MAG: hypothetical protein MRY32_06400 [Rickettsiales bacterium]|nr:hypothetical protein [Rickettsiales bacterium]